jgi:hypothetical protein
MEPPGLLKRADQRDRRLGSLVLVSPCALKTVAAAARLRVEKLDAGVVHAQEPQRRAHAELRPLALAGRVERACAGVGHRACLDRLLVEAGPRLAAAPSSDGREAEVVVAQLDADEPREQEQALFDELRLTEGEPARDSGLREPRVVVGEALFGPRPLAARLDAADPGARRFEQRCGAGMAWTGEPDLGSSQQRLRVRARGRRRERGRAGLEADERTAGQLVVPAPDRDAEPEERVAVRVVRADLVGPLDVGLGREPVVEAAVGELCPFQETQIDEREPVECERPCGLTGDDREGAGDVVGAVAVRDPGGVEECVLEDPGLVAQRSQMCKRRRRDALGSSQNSARFRTGLVSERLVSEWCSSQDDAVLSVPAVWFSRLGATSRAIRR